MPEKQDKVESELLASFISPSGLHIQTVSCAALITFGTAYLFDKCSVIWNDISFPGLEFEEEGRGSEIRVSVVRAF